MIYAWRTCAHKYERYCDAACVRVCVCRCVCTHSLCHRAPNPQARHRRRGLLSTVSLFEKRLPRFERKASTVEALHAAFASAGVTDPDATMRDMLGKIEEMQRAERAATGMSVHRACWVLHRLTCVCRAPALAQPTRCDAFAKPWAWRRCNKYVGVAAPSLAAVACAQRLWRAGVVGALAVEGLESTFEEDRHLVGDVGDMRMRDVTHHMGASVDDEHL